MVEQSEQSAGSTSSHWSNLLRSASANASQKDKSRGRDRTDDLEDMSLARYRCATLLREATRPGSNRHYLSDSPLSGCLYLPAGRVRLA